MSPSGGVFYLQDPSAPPLSRGGSAASSSRDRGDESGFPASPDTSRNHRHPWRDRVKPLPLPPSKGARTQGDAPEHTRFVLLNVPVFNVGLAQSVSKGRLLLGAYGIRGAAF